MPDEIPIYWRMKAAYVALIDLGLVEPNKKKARKKTYRSCEQAEAAAAKNRERHRQRDEDRRREAGSVTRAEYLANSLSQTRPWEQEGISRDKWYRLRRVVRKRQIRL